ncbi:MAG: DUF3365 domain-containing protein [Acidobacteriota bacterium]|nr:DUF3365 domain-containing protein [Acidobacteriota bacterium]
MTKLTKLKLACCLLWAIFLTGAVFWKKFLPVGVAAPKENEKPSMDLIEKFDAAIQQRFLTEPGFGISRIVFINPAVPNNPHLTNFIPKDADEKTSVESFQADGWRAALYLFGRRIEKQTNEKNGKTKFYISNRTFAPMPITKNVKAENLKPSANLIDEAANAFEAFQTSDKYEFDNGRWAYVAKPVRAQQSCLQCHTDYVMTSKIGEKPYKYRKRQKGDAIGVLVYGFEEGK